MSPQQQPSTNTTGSSTHDSASDLRSRFAASAASALSAKSSSTAADNTSNDLVSRFLSSATSALEEKRSSGSRLPRRRRDDEDDEDDDDDDDYEDGRAGAGAVAAPRSPGSVASRDSFLEELSWPGRPIFGPLSNYGDLVVGCIQLTQGGASIQISSSAEDAASLDPSRRWPPHYYYPRGFAVISSLAEAGVSPPLKEMLSALGQSGVSGTYVHFSAPERKGEPAKNISPFLAKGTVDKIGRTGKFATIKPDRPMKGAPTPERVMLLPSVVLGGAVDGEDFASLEGRRVQFAVRDNHKKEASFRWLATAVWVLPK
jgi:hypothetical protein